MKKLNNIDVLYSLLNIDNERLKILAQELNFSNTLDFLSIDNTSLTDQCKLDRFYIDILPRIHHNVRCFILEPEFVFVLSILNHNRCVILINFNLTVANHIQLLYILDLLHLMCNLHFLIMRGTISEWNKDIYTTSDQIKSLLS